MSGAWRIGIFAGIGVFVHWTFLLLPAVLAISELSGDGPLQDRVIEAVKSIVFVLAVFFCVVLHEYGHALTARRYGVKTRDIVLLPIGGVARLERIPREPVQELWIALAGPAVNVVIASVLGVVILIVGTLRGGVLESAQSDAPVRALATLMFVNIILIVFNMIPAFPMDGGRVLRSLLAMRLEYGRATQVAARTGQVIAVAFVALALFTGHYMLLLIAAMVYFGAAAELRQTLVLSRLAGLRVRDAMMTEFVTIAPSATLQQCAEALLAGSQTVFPVVETADPSAPPRFVGLIARDRIIEGVRQGFGDERASSHLSSDVPVFAPEAAASEAFEQMASRGVSAAPVIADGALAGLVTIDNIAELFELRSGRAVFRR